MPNSSATWKKFATLYFASCQQTIDTGTKTAEESHMNDTEVRLGRYRPIPDKREGCEPCLIFEMNNAVRHIDSALLVMCAATRRLEP